MRVGILVPSIGAFGQKGFYNAQEIGLAKAMDAFCTEVKVYRLVDESQEERTEHIEGSKNANVWFMPSKRIGNNGLFDVSVLDKTLDALVFFSDTQFVVPNVYRWARKNNVVMLPYIGVLESHSTSRLKKLIVDFLFQRNISVYRKCHCLAKTPKVKEGLKDLGVDQATVVPVGLDLTLMKQDFEQTDSLELRKKYGYQPEDKVLLFVGRMIEEKQPVRMIDIFARACQKDARYRLLMVGSGELRNSVEEAIAEYGITDKVRLIDRIPNSDIWELYRIADCFVNLNQQEIFGMAILEAMYYGCKVVAWEAPGPSFIIENGVSGFLGKDEEGILTSICEKQLDRPKISERILNHFTWDKSAAAVCALIKN